MSAIFGLVRSAHAPILPHELDAMSTALAQHGRDATASVIAGGVGLGATIMRITLEDRHEAQPLTDSRSGLSLVWDGRLDNRRELAMSLGLDDAASLQLSDSAIVFRAFEHWGTGAVERLVGVFALALWRQAHCELTLARSPLTARPLFYAQSREGFAFATAPSGILATGIPRQVDLDYLADYLSHVWPTPGTTFYRGISSVAPGHVVTVSPDGLSTHPFWAFTPRDLQLRSDDDHVMAFSELFERVVGDYVRSERPAGIFLSGGLDSSSIAAVAAPRLAVSGKSLLSFTEIPSTNPGMALPAHRYADESPYVGTLSARFTNLTSHFVQAGDRFVTDGLDKMFRAMERPYYWPTNRLWIEAGLERAHDANVGAMLWGTSGNVTMSWNGAGLLPQLTRRGRLLSAWREAGAPGTPALQRLKNLIAEGVVPSIPMASAARERIRHRGGSRASSTPHAHISAIRPEFARARCVADRSQSTNDPRLRRLDGDTAPYRLALLERVSEVSTGIDAGYQAMFGIDSRDPTADVRLVEFCLSLPESQCRRGGETRWLIRRAMQSKLPAAILTNRRRGFQSADWIERLKGQQRELNAELNAIGESALAREALDIPRLRALVQRLPSVQTITVDVVNDYRGILDAGLMVGRFLLWAQQ